MRGRLIAIEGIDGSGKSTQARLLVKRLGEPVALLTREPGSTVLGAKLRSLLLDAALPGISPKAEALLMAADRAEHVSQVVGPALEAGRWVVTDRYTASTLAYQGYGRGLDLDELRSLNAFASGGVQADLNVLLDVPLSSSRSRLGAAAPDRLEALDEEFHKRVVDGYLELASNNQDVWAVVDGTGEVDDVSRRVIAVVESRLGAPAHQEESPEQ